MNDEETAALIVGGHTLRQDPRRRRRRPGRSRARGRPDRAAGPGLEVRRSAPARPATPSPAASRWCGPPRRRKWSNSFLENLYGNEWELTKSPAGAWQFVAKDAEADHPRPVRRTEPQAHDAGHRHLAARGPDLRARSPAAGWTIPRSSPRRSPRRGTSCCTATWARSPATSGRGSPSRSCGRTRYPRSITS